MAALYLFQEILFQKTDIPCRNYFDMSVELAKLVFYLCHLRSGFYLICAKNKFHNYQLMIQLSYILL